MADGKQVFRQKSLDRLESPEQLNDYIRVMNPGIWFLIAGIIVLLIGTCVWGVFGKIGEINIDSAVTIVENGTLKCYIDEYSLPDEDLPEAATIKVASLGANSQKYQEYGAENFEWTVLPTEDPEEMKLLEQVGYVPGEKVLVLSVACELSDGLYSADVSFAGMAPISLLDKN